MTLPRDQRSHPQIQVGDLVVICSSTVLFKNLHKGDVGVVIEIEPRFYNQPKTITYEASINSNFFSDTYLTMSNISDTNIFNIKFQKKPFMNFIWLSVLLISLGGILNFFKRKKEI